MLRGAPWCVLLVGAVIAGCRAEGGETEGGDSGAGGQAAGTAGGDSGSPGGTGGNGVTGGGGTSSTGGALPGGGTSAGGMGTAGDGAGGTGGVGEHSGGMHGGGAGAAGGSGGTTGGSGNASGGTGGEEALHRCEQFEDRTAAGAERRVPWSFAMVSAPERCMLVRVGQSVEFAGNFASHPLGASGGDEPNPFSSVASVDPSLRSVSFPVEGTFGYECGIHATMVGVVRVVP